MLLRKSGHVAVARLTVLLAVTGSLLVAACDPVPRADQQELRVAFLVEEGGDAAGLDAEYRNAAELVRREVARQGGIATPRGRAALRVDVITHGPGVEDGLRAMRQALASGACVVIGGGTSAQAVPMAALAEERRMPFVSPGATVSQLTTGRDYVFRMSYSDAFQARALARLCRNRGATRAAVLFEQGSVYSRSLAEEFQRAFAAMGGQRPSAGGCQELDRDGKPMLLKLLRPQPEVLFLPVYHLDAPRLVRLARAMGFKGLLVGPDGWDLVSPRELADMVGARYLVPWHADGPQSGLSQAFLERYTTAFGRQPSSVAALVYDAFGLVFLAAGQAQVLEPQALAAALRGIAEYSGVAGPGRYVLGTPERDAEVVEITAQGVRYAGSIPGAEPGGAPAAGNGGRS